MKTILLSLGLIISAWIAQAATPETASNGGDAVPEEFISEIIPIRYAKASEIAAAPEFVAVQAVPGPGYNRDRTPKVKVIVDERSNSLLVFASRLDMFEIKLAVTKLDVRLKQILVEAVVLERRLPDNRDGEHPAVVDDYLRQSSGRWSANFVSTIGKQDGVNYIAGLGTNFDSAIALLLRDRHLNIDVIQKPRILTSNGISGSIFVDPTVPYPTSPAPENPGVELTVTPAITANGEIVMELALTTGKVAGKAPTDGMGDVSNTRSTRCQASATVRDGEALLIGGVSGNFRRHPSEIFILLRPTVVRSEK